MFHSFIDTTRFSSSGNPVSTDTNSGASPEKEIASTSHRDNNFNFLRLMLATLVILSHSPALINNDTDHDPLHLLFGTVAFGTLAVCGFFMISGYLIVQSWQNDPRWFDFLKKRILRIYPGFIAASLVSAFVVGPLGTDAAQYFARLKPLLFFRGMVQLNMPAVPTSFPGTPLPSVNGSMWTIIYEFRCYLLVALLGVCGLVRRRWVWPAISIISLVVYTISQGGKVPALRLSEDWQNNFYFVAFFAAGACFYHFRVHIRYRKRWAAVAALILAGGLFSYHTVYLALITAGSYLMFWFAFSSHPSLNGFRKWSDVSYGTYLYGWPIQKLLLWYTPINSALMLFLVATALSYVAGFVSWHAVEKPFLRLKKNTVA